jgi:outer membrane protein assembly factor BamB
MFRTGDVESVIAMDAQTGKTAWQTDYGEPFQNSFGEAGNGPYSMPLVLGDRLYTAGATGTFQADRKTGKVIWKKELIADIGGTPMQFGYSCQPLVYGDTLIMMVGGRGHAIMAFRQKDGSVAWQKQDFANSYSSPVLIHVDGEEQVVAFMGNDVVGVDPKTGDLRWSHPHPTPYNLAISMPVWDEADHLLFYSAAYNTGAYVLELRRQGEKTAVKEVWKDNHIQVHFGSILRIGEYVYCSSGHDGPALFTAVNIKTGKVAWRERGFAKASFLLADGKLILVDQEGNLGLVRVSPERLEVLSKVALLKSNAWTVPTLVGTRLYLRDRHDIMALDVGKS